MHYNKLDECRPLWGEPSRAVSKCDYTLHVLAQAACFLIGEKVGDTGSNTSSSRISYLFIALYKTCLLTHRSAHIVAVVTQWTITKL